MDLAGLSQDICQEYMAAHLEVLKMLDIQKLTETNCYQIVRDFQQALSVIGSLHEVSEATNTASSRDDFAASRCH